MYHDPPQLSNKNTREDHAKKQVDLHSEIQRLWM
jgi:hypothetical protein